MAGQVPVIIVQNRGPVRKATKKRAGGRKKKAQTGGAVNPAIFMEAYNLGRKHKPITKVSDFLKSSGATKAIRRGRKSKNPHVRNISTATDEVGKAIGKVGKFFGFGNLGATGTGRPKHIKY